jgi:hypothetical protein
VSTAFEDRYELLGLLAEGGQAGVFRARDRKLDREVAIKLLPAGQSDPEAEARFRRECEVLARIAHPAVVQVLDSGRTGDGVLFLTMPLLDGARSLAQIARSGKLAPPSLTPECRQALEDVADGLDALHAQGVMHRDVSPANVLVVPPGRGVLVDLGLARVTGQTMTSMGGAPGTLAYLSPEVATFEQATAASDRFQLGLIAYLMVTGRDPVTDPVEFARRVSCGQAPVPPASFANPQVSGPVDDVLRRATAVDPAKRFPSCRAFVAELVRAYEDVGVPNQTVRLAVSSKPGGRSGRTRRPARPNARGKLVPALAGLLLAVLAWMVRPASAPTPAPSPSVAASALPAVEKLRAIATERGLSVRFATASPVRARIEVMRGAESVRVPGRDTAETEHHVLVPVTSMPFTRRLRIELSVGHASTVHEVGLEEASRRAWCEVAGAWFSGQVAQYWHRYVEPDDPLKSEDLDQAVRRVETELPPAWFLDELGGPHGALAALDDASKLHAVRVANRRGADLNHLREIRGVTERYPIEKVLSPHEGWSDRPHYPRAREVPLPIPRKLPDGQPFEILPEVPVYLLEGSRDDRRDVRFELELEAEMPPVEADTRVELHARLLLPPGRACIVEVGAHTVPIVAREGRHVQSPRDIYAAFSPSALKPRTRFKIRCPNITQMVEMFHPRPGVKVETLSVRIEE